MLAARLRRDGPRGSLELAFDARLRKIEGAWRDYLKKLSERRLDGSEAIAELELPDELSA